MANTGEIVQYIPGAPERDIQDWLERLRQKAITKAGTDEGTLFEKEYALLLSVYELFMILDPNSVMADTTYVAANYVDSNYVS